MSNQSSANNKRIAKNTGLLYVRMLVTMFISFYTSRIVLQQLGVEDFGINNVVAGFVSILAFFTSSLTNVTQRFLNIGLGRGNLEETTCYFKQSFTIMVVISVAVVIVGLTLGLWFVSNKLVIPRDRLNAALWIFVCSLLSTVCAIIQVSFMGAIVAREKMNAYAYLGLFEAFARLAIAYCLIVTTIDHLVLYGCLTALVSILVTLFYATYSIRYFPECRCRLYFDKRILSEMSKFVGVNLFGCLGWSIGVQGVTVIINLFFGPTVNAARGIAMQISGVIMRFTDSIMTAVKPQIIKSYASDNISYMLQLLEKSSRYSFFLVCFVAVPVIVDCRLVLEVWLGQVPDYSVPFTQLIILEQMFTMLSNPLWIVANATGKINRSQIYGRLFTLSSLPISYILLVLSPNPVFPMMILVLTNCCYWLYCIYDIHMQVELSYKEYTLNVILPSLIFFLIMIFVGNLIAFVPCRFHLQHILYVTLLTDSIGLILLTFLLSKEEKKCIMQLVKSRIYRG